MSNLKSLQSLQNKALRCIFKDKSYSTEEAHTRANLLLLKDRRKINIVAMAHSRRIPHLRPTLKKPRNLRSNSKLQLEKPRSNNVKFENSFIVCAISYWNSLPSMLKVCLDPSLFKTRIKLELKQGKINFPE